MSEYSIDEKIIEPGSNEIEIMRFVISGNIYGINVAKVKEIMLCEPVQSMPHVHFAVEGIFKPRDLVLTVIDLPSFLKKSTVEKTEKDLFIVTSFNNLSIAFRVHSVEGISRISWRDIHSPDATVASSSGAILTGITQIGKDIISILDFEKIIMDIAPETGIQVGEVDTLGQRNNNSAAIWVAEDSTLLTKLIHTSLEKAKYENVTMFANGAELWKALGEIKDRENLDDYVKLVITDLEMPEMDGHMLIKLIKEDKDFKKLPVVIFSSLISEQMREKGKQVGADEQLSKPEIGKLVGIIDRFVN